MSAPVNLTKVSVLGCGWLGLPLGRELLRRGYAVKGSSTTAEKLPVIKAYGIEAFQITLDEELLGDRLSDFFDADVLVLNIPPGRRNPEVEERHPRQIETLRLRVEKSPIKFVLFVSSTSVYASTNGIVTEGNNEEPATASGRALRRAEQILRVSDVFDTTIVRFGGLVGGDRDPGRFMAGKKELPNAETPVNLIHLDDCVEILSRIIEGDVRGETFNAVSDEHPSRRDFYTAQAKRLRLPIPEFLSAPMENFKIVSNERLKERLQYEFLHPDPKTMFS